MRNPYNPIPIILASIFSSGIGFSFLGIWLGDKIPHDERVLLGIGIAFVIIAIGLAICASILSRRQSSFDQGSIPPD